MQNCRFCVDATQAVVRSHVRMTGMRRNVACHVRQRQAPGERGHRCGSGASARHRLVTHQLQAVRQTEHRGRRRDAEPVAPCSALANSANGPRSNGGRDAVRFCGDYFIGSSGCRGLRHGGRGLRQHRHHEVASHGCRGLRHGCRGLRQICRQGAVCAHMRAQGRTRAPGWIWTTGG